MTDARKEYGDIIDLPHHRSAKRQPMSLHDRAAQFAPFAALKGYDEEIKETARVTDSRAELSEEEIFMLNEKTHFLLERIEENPKVRVTYFVPDEKKEGGSYQIKEGSLRRIDEVLRILHFTDRTEISIDDIQSIEIE